MRQSEMPCTRLAFNTTVNTTSVRLRLYTVQGMYKRTRVKARASVCTRASLFPSFQIFQASGRSPAAARRGTRWHLYLSSHPPPGAHELVDLSRVGSIRLWLDPTLTSALHIRVQSACVRVCTDVCVTTSVRAPVRAPVHKRPSLPSLPIQLHVTCSSTVRHTVLPPPLPFLLSPRAQPVLKLAVQSRKSIL